MSADDNAPPPTDHDLIAKLVALSAEDRAEALRALSDPMRRELHDRWEAWAHAAQLPPAGDWSIWMIRAGRGFGKTRAGAEWVSDFARATPDARVALVGATAEDVRRVMIEGQSGLINVCRLDEQVAWRGAAGEVRFASGARAFVYSAEAAEALRGPEHHAAWCDELAKWRRGDCAWDNLMLGLRLGEHPRVIVTTTPRPTSLMRRVMGLPGLIETRGATRDNPWLPDSFVAAMERHYAGTRLGRQELEGELIDDVPGALWTRAMMEACRAASHPALARVIVAVDPPAGAADGDGDACGIVAVGLGEDDVGYVIDDASVPACSPETWAAAVAECAARHGADRVVAEANNGGQMVASVLLAAGRGLPVTLVYASRGKAARAEPVATLYECGRVRHLGVFPMLEDQLCGLIVGGDYAGPGRSPDRADALVWALTELMLGNRGQARIAAL